MWVLVLLDIAILRREDRRDSEKFKRFLFENGFHAFQYSVFAAKKKKEELENLKKVIVQNLPERGRADILYITDQQFENIVSFYGKRHRPLSNSTGQIDLF
ncbi:MAG: CRISPR-associated endonuclease Cas2 [Spirochaetales bacterium]|nr:CRISPR-associated endonuclease Cas2 [Spirochaetales bacterium]